MIYQTYRPRFPLSDFVELLWFFEGADVGYTKERVLPNGVSELVINLQPELRRLFDREDFSRCQTFRRSWISGTHSEFIVIEATAHSSMMGVHFKPGGACPFFEFPMTELTDTVVELDTIWGARANDLRDQLLELADPMDKFCVLETYLLQNARQPLRSADAVGFALRHFEATPHDRTIQAVAQCIGISQKHLIHEFSRRVGLTPKLFCRVRRFQRVLQQIERQRHVEWADIACACGYYDQAHFVRDFQSFSGLNPTGYLTVRGEYINHVPIRDVDAR